MTARPRQNIDTEQSQIATLFRENKPAQVSGYVGVEGQALGTPGDEDAPYAKVPSFTTEVIDVARSFPVVNFAAVGAEYSALPEIECRQQRLLELYFTYVLGAGGGRLSIIPEGFAQGSWFALSLVDAAVTPFTPVGTRFIAGGFGSRPIELTEVRTDILAANRTARWCATFDVAALESFRINVLDVAAGGAGNLLTVGYALAT